MNHTNYDQNTNYIFNNYMDTKNRSEPENRRNVFLDRIALFHRLLGITYRGWRSSSDGKKPDTRPLWIAYETIIIIAIFSYSIYAIIIIPDILFKSSSTKFVMKAVIRMASYVSIGQFLTLKVVLFINGPKLMDLIYDLSEHSNQSGISFRVFAFMFTHSVLYGVAFSCTSFSMDSSRNFSLMGFRDNPTVFTLTAFNFLAGIGASVHMTSVTVLLIIVSEMVSYQLKSLTINMANNEAVEPICGSALAIREFIEKLNALLYHVTIVKLVLNSIMLSGGVCVISDNMRLSAPNYYLVAGIVFSVLLSAVDIEFSCRSSQNMIDSMEALCQASESRLTREQFSAISRQQIEVILNQRKRIRFSAAGLFDLRDRTNLQILYYATTYAVILIQTE